MVALRSEAPSRTDSTISKFNSPSDKAKAEFATRLRSCTSLIEVRAVHEEIAKDGREKGTFLGNILVQMYGRYREIELARDVFDGINWKNVFSWTMIISAYAQNGQSREAIHLYRNMCQGGMVPDKVAYLSIVCACGEMGNLSESVLIQERVMSTGLDLDVVLANAVIVMLGKCKSVKHARGYFDTIQFKDVISWNSILAVYVQLGHPTEALKLYQQMLQVEPPDEATFVATLGACALLEDLNQGRSVHQMVVRRGYGNHLLVGTAALNMYGKCGRCDEAREAFDCIPGKDTICWTNMIGAYAQYGEPEEAFRLTWKMELEGFKPNTATFVSLIEACSRLGELKAGRRMHARIVANNMDKDIVLGTGILHMYAKFGSVAEARDMFQALKWMDLDTVTWNCMLMAYAANGYGREALELYQEMVVHGVAPTDMTYVGIFCACSHLGLWEKGHEHFGCMVREFGIEATGDHYGCMVDLLGRSGRLAEAESLIESMPVHPGSVVWKVLLSACKVHGNMELGGKAAALASELEPHDDSTYVLLSTILTS